MSYTVVTLRATARRFLDYLPWVALSVTCAMVGWTFIGPTDTSQYLDAPPDHALSLVGVSLAGSARAEVVLAEFADFECPYCRRFAKEVFPALKHQYVDGGRMRFAFMHLPLGIHKYAKPAATAAECAGEQGAFWQMHDHLFAAPDLTDASIRSALRSLQLDDARADSCLARSPTERIDADMRLASELGVRGTPAFFLGRMNGNHELHVTRVVRGAAPLAVFSKVIDETLHEK